MLVHCPQCLRDKGKQRKGRRVISDSLHLGISHNQLKEMINAYHSDPLLPLGLEPNQLLVQNCENIWSLGTAFSKAPTTGK